jgi:hypothetical protein
VSQKRQHLLVFGPWYYRVNPYTGTLANERFSGSRKAQIIRVWTLITTWCRSGKIKLAKLTSFCFVCPLPTCVDVYTRSWNSNLSLEGCRVHPVSYCTPYILLLLFRISTSGPNGHPDGIRVWLTCADELEDASVNGHYKPGNEELLSRPGLVWTKIKWLTLLLNTK